MSDSVRPHRQQPTQLPHPWDSPSKNTGVGCHFLLQSMKVKSEKWKWSHFSRVRLCATPWTAAYQASPSTGFSRQKYWSGVPLPSPFKCAVLYVLAYVYTCDISTVMKIMSLSFTPKVFWGSFVIIPSHPFLYPGKKAYSVIDLLFLTTQYLHSLEFYVNRIRVCTLFFWFLSPSAIILRLIHVVACIYNLFLFIAH